MEDVIVNNLGIPPLAGLCTYEAACGLGYSVEQNVNLLRRYNYLETRLNEIAAAHLARTPDWEVKCALSLHLWLDAQHSAALRERVAEMREPPLHLDQVPDTRLGMLLDEAIRADSTVELLVGIYRVLRPELARALQKHLTETNPLVDQPTCRILKWHLQEELEMIAWGEQALAALTRTPDLAAAARDWEVHLRAFLTAAGGLSGDLEGAEELPRPRSDGQPYEMDAVPRRDDRFVDCFNQSALIDDYYMDETRPPDERGYALYYKRLREMDVPEWMAPIIYKTKGKPWSYYVDLSRQLWDEVRHAMMGEVGLYKAGLPFYTYPVDLKSSMSLNTEYSPLEAHLVLWDIEQSLMPRDIGKRFEWELALSTKDDLLVTFQDYDWADEVLHTQIGRQWLAPEFENFQQLRDAAANARQRWRGSLEKYIERSNQAEWWPLFLADIRQRQASRSHPSD